MPNAKPFTGRRNHGRTHSYLLDGQRTMSVTEIINKGYPKPALTTWAAKETATFVADNRELIWKLQRDEMIDLAKGAPFRDRDRAAGRGTEVHRLARAITEHREVEVPEELVGHVDAHMAFLEAWQPRNDHLEVSVYSRRWRYGGTFDWLTQIPHLGDSCLLELKTNRSGPFGEAALQFAGYGNAEFYLDDQGCECAMPEIDWYGILWLRADGADLYRYDVTEEEFRVFLYCQRIAQWMEERGDYRGARPVKGEALPWPASKQAAS